MTLCRHVFTTHTKRFKVAFHWYISVTVDSLKRINRAKKRLAYDSAGAAVVAPAYACEAGGAAHTHAGVLVLNPGRRPGPHLLFLQLKQADISSWPSTWAHFMYVHILLNNPKNLKTASNIDPQ